MTKILEHLKLQYGYTPETAIPVTEHEELLLEEVLRGEALHSQIGSYSVFADHQDEQISILVFGPGISIKYIHAIDPKGVKYFMALPQEWCEYHFGIKGRIEYARKLKIEADKVAGGYLTVEHGMVYCKGRSMDFGEGSHALAQPQFQKLIEGKNLVE